MIDRWRWRWDTDADRVADPPHVSRTLESATRLPVHDAGLLVVRQSNRLAETAARRRAAANQLPGQHSVAVLRRQATEHATDDACPRTVQPTAHHSRSVATTDTLIIASSFVAKRDREAAAPPRLNFGLS